MGFKKLRNESFENNLNKNARVTFTTVDSPMTTSLLNDGDGKTFISVRQLGIKISFNASETINCIVLQEPIQMGQRIKSFSIQLKNKNGLIKEIKGTTIGRK